MTNKINTLENEVILQHMNLDNQRKLYEKLHGRFNSTFYLVRFHMYRYRMKCSVVKQWNNENIETVLLEIIDHYEKLLFPSDHDVLREINLNPLTQWMNYYGRVIDWKELILDSDKIIFDNVISPNSNKNYINMFNNILDIAKEYYKANLDNFRNTLESNKVDTSTFKIVSNLTDIFDSGYCYKGWV